MTGELELVAAGGDDQWQRIDSAVSAFSEEQQWPSELDFSVRLFLEELVLNVMMHGSDDGSAEVRLNIQSTGQEVRMVISDNGKPFNPLEETPEPDLDSSVEDRRVGGLGVHMVRNMADDFQYQFVDGYNRVTVVKRRG